MKCKQPALLGLLAACLAMSCSADGGQSGTGVSAIRGNVAAVAGTPQDVADIRVSLAQTELQTVTDATGRFALQGQVSGPGELLFERERDGLFASTDVVIPAGGLLELAEIELDPDSGEARPTQRRVEFEGFVEAIDCAGGTILVAPKEDELGETFVVDVASATIRHDDALLECGDLRIGDRLQVDAETVDGVTLINAEIVLEDREDEPGDDEEEETEDDSEDESEDDQSDHVGEDDADSKDESDDDAEDETDDDAQAVSDDDPEDEGPDDEPESVGDPEVPVEAVRR